ncbi:MAG: efflux RND transporter periplasmic adaptor subunit [Dehalococcoidales bacterium]|nr:efflux RND transporter periplasmic adaptor subunit [Dehalococcoidales bacterium]
MTGSKIAVMVLSITLAGTLLAGCGGVSDIAEKPEYQLVPVQRGDLAVEVTATGNLSYAYEEVLSFGAPGTIEEVLVEEGDEVEEGQLLARLDSASIISLEKAVTQARINLRGAEDDLEEVRNPSTEVDAVDIAQAELAVVNAGIALVTARDNLELALDPYTESDIIQAELAVISAEVALEAAQYAFERAEATYNGNPTVPQWVTDYEQKQRLLALAEFDLIEAEENLAEMQAGADASEVEQKQKLLAVAEADIARAEETLAEIQDDAVPPEPDSLDVELQQIEVTSARAALDEAIDRLEMDTVVAPFAGIVTSVNMEAGQAVNASAVIVLTDSTKFEATMLVNEIDIMNVQVGALASVEIDALSGFTFPATVTSVSPTAASQQGVVNYRVEAELMSLVPATEEEVPEEEGEPVSGVDEVLDKAVADGRLTQEQADTMKERFGQADTRITAEQLEQLIERFAQFGIGAAQGKAGQREGLAGGLLDELRGSLIQGFGAGLLPGVSLEDIHLREGLSVTVSIIIQQRRNVLLVPNQAIKLQDGATYVEVIQDGEIHQRSVVTGLSDWQYTEIVQGINEGEQVVVWQTTGTSATTEAQRQQGGFGIIPGVGRLTK